MLEKIWSVEGNLAMEDTSLVWDVDFVEVIDSGSNYLLEMSIPLGLLGVDLIAGSVIGFDAKIGDNDGDGLDGKLSWNQFEDEGWRNPSFLGEVTLMGNGTFMGSPFAPNNPPVIDVIENVDVDIAATVDVTVTVTDADEDEVTISAVSGDEAIATVTIADAVITVTGVAEGTATITVSATDGEDAAEDVTFDVMVVDPSVGIKEIQTGFNMYPNPASSMFTLSSAAEIKSVSISNVTGQLVYSSAVNGFNADVSIQSCAD